MIMMHIIITINIVLGSSEPTDYELEAGDINQDGILNILDIISLLNIILDGE